MYPKLIIVWLWWEPEMEIKYYKLNEVLQTVLLGPMRDPKRIGKASKREDIAEMNC